MICNRFYMFKVNKITFNFFHNIWTALIRPYFDYLACLSEGMDLTERYEMALSHSIRKFCGLTHIQQSPVELFFLNYEYKKLPSIIYD